MALPEQNGSSHTGYLESSMPTPATSLSGQLKVGDWSYKKKARALGTVRLPHVIGCICSNEWVMWSCQANTVYVPNTWLRFSSILGLVTVLQWMLMTGMDWLQWLGYTVLWTRIPLRELPPHNPGWWEKTERRSPRQSATACSATTWYKTTLRLTIIFTHTCICLCSAP